MFYFAFTGGRECFILSVFSFQISGVHFVNAVVAILAKPVNMRDSLKVDPKKGSVIQKKYKGTFPAADGPGKYFFIILHFLLVTLPYNKSPPAFCFAGGLF